MKRWLVFIESRELARELGDPLIGRVLAHDRQGAIDAANRGEWIDRSIAVPVCGGGFWPVLERDLNDPLSS